MSFELDVWDDLGRAVAELPNETEVVVRGRLAKGPQDDVVRVRAYDVKVGEAVVCTYRLFTRGIGHHAHRWSRYA